MQQPKKKIKKNQETKTWNRGEKKTERRRRKKKPNMSLSGSCAATAESEKKPKANKTEKIKKFIIFLTEKLRRFEAWERESERNEKNRFFFLLLQAAIVDEDLAGDVGGEEIYPRAMSWLCLHQTSLLMGKESEKGGREGESAFIY